MPIDRTQLNCQHAWVPLRPTVRMLCGPLSWSCLRRQALADRGCSKIQAMVLSLLLCLATLLSACSGSSSGDTENPAVDAVFTDPPGSVPSGGVPDGLLQLEDDPGLLSAIPDVVSSEIRADTGLQIAYTRLGQAAAAPGAMIEAQWLHMQSCLEQVASAPVVIIRDGPVLPFTANDDVIFNVDGVPIASASHKDIAIIQVRESDFDGSLGNPGFNLRSIMGRLLWLNANLPERDYPFACAQQQP